METKSKTVSLRRQVTKYALIVLGSVIYATGFQFFMFPNHIVSGGVTGIAMILNRFTNWPVGMMVLTMNIPLFHRQKCMLMPRTISRHIRSGRE